MRLVLIELIIVTYQRVLTHYVKLIRAITGNSQRANQALFRNLIDSVHKYLRLFITDGWTDGQTILINCTQSDRMFTCAFVHQGGETICV